MSVNEISFRSTLSAAEKEGIAVNNSSAPNHGCLSGDGVGLHFVDWGGDGLPAVVFIHGFLQQSRTWDLTCLALRDRFRCFSLDLRGHGESGKPRDPDYATEHYLADLERMCDYLYETLQLSSLTLCGLSLGGQLSYLYASRHPERVRSIAVVDVAPQLNREARKGVQRYISALPREGAFDALVERVAEISPIRSRDQVRASLLRATRVSDDGSWGWKHDERLLDHHRVSFTTDQLWAALGSVSAPTLFILGRNSRMVSADTVRQMVQLVAGSSAAYVDNASHRVPGDNPTGFLRALEPFLMRHAIASI